MNTKTSTMISVLVISIIFGFILYLNIFHKPFAGKLKMESMRGGKGISTDEMRPQYKQSDPSKWSPETRKRVEAYEKDVVATNEAWQLINTGDNYVKSNDYEKSIDVYKRAYQVDRGSRMYVGFLLIPVYERLHRYDEALSLLDEMRKEFQLSEKGKQDFAETRARLLAEKEKAGQTSAIHS